tara:strand:- start:670 stop:885 length:216 start_codon:yes stop_codon:yes gene_type:complete
LYQIIGKRHRDDLPTIFTSNIQQIGQRIAWRIMEMYGRTSSTCRTQISGIGVYAIPTNDMNDMKCAVTLSA